MWSFGTESSSFEINVIEGTRFCSMFDLCMYQCSTPTVARHIFQACPVWIHTQSNITSIIFTWVHYTNTEKIMMARKCFLVCPPSETWLGNNVSWFAHHRETWLGNTASRLGKHGWEIMFPCLLTFGRHCLLTSRKHG
jgi:hypothetical protein